MANIDLGRKVGYKVRRKKRGIIDHTFYEYREERTFCDYEDTLEKDFCEWEVIEMDTVIGRKGKGKRLLTMIFRKNSIMLIFLLPDSKAESVIRVFDYLEAGLEDDRFRRLFPIFLTDNDREFK